MQLPQFTPSSAFDEKTVEIQKIFNKTKELCVFLVFHGIAPQLVVNQIETIPSIRQQ